jgi:hypothetical protein
VLEDKNMDSNIPYIDKIIPINIGILLNEIEKFAEIPENIKETTKLTKYVSMPPPELDP